MKKSNKIKKTLWVSSVCPEKINGRTFIPSVIYYDNEKSFFGYQALDSAGESGLLNREFKVALGEVTPGGSVDRRIKFRVNGGQEKTAFEISQDYINGLLSVVEDRFPRDRETLKHPAKILVAEPLNFQLSSSSPGWTKNYRENLRRILDRYEDVEFLPEPFAVYQYYRYGRQIPQLQSLKKHVAFIIDFGGGTFDACVIESNKDGDVSQSGKHSKPLSADSVAVGGFVVNREIAKYLSKVFLSDSQKRDVDKYLDQYERVLKGNLDPDILSEKYKSFIKNFISLEVLAESYKIDLSLQISDWRLDAPAYDFVSVKIPRDPFSEGSWVDHELRAHQLRKIFSHEIWTKKLKPVVKNVLKIAEDKLGSKSISVTLVSGGSSNLRWLNEHLKNEFSSELSDAKPVKISESFQDVVSNGLAIECARRYFTNESEFVAVTYNPIRLDLLPDGEPSNRAPRYKSVGDVVDMSGAREGDLLPSAQDLSHFFDRELVWQVKLPKAPRNYLKYYFTRPDDSERHFNIEETKLFTRDSKNFDSKTQISLVAREDGTVIPKFIYKRENEIGGVSENSELGKPFYIDMTSISASSEKKEFYLGFDFGTSNSSICILSPDQIELINDRQAIREWRGLAEESSGLPYPVAHPVRKFLSNYDVGRQSDLAREAIEAALAFLAYFAAAEAIHAGYDLSTLKNFRHRSAGPLVGILEESIRLLGDKAVYTEALSSLVKGDREQLQSLLNDINGDKHHTKLDSEIKWVKHLEFIVQAVCHVMEGKCFGYVLKSDEDPFSGVFEASFKVANDVPPFIETRLYKCNSSLAKMFAWVVDEERGQALSLSPLIIWGDTPTNHVSPNCYLINKPGRNGDVTYKFCEKSEEINAVNVHPGFQSAANRLFCESSLLGGIIDLKIDA